MTTVSLRVDDAFGAMLHSAAREAGVSISTFVKRGLEAFLEITKQKRAVPSFMKHAGCLSHKEAEALLEFNRKASFSQIEPDMWS